MIFPLGSLYVFKSCKAVEERDDIARNGDMEAIKAQT